MRSFDFGSNMIKYILLIVCLFFVVPAHSQGQQGTFTNPQGGTLIAQSADCSVVYSCVWMKLPNNANTTTITIGGTFSATILIEESGNGGVTFFTVATLSSAGLTTYATSGLSDIRARISAFTSGGVNVTINTGVNAGGNVSTSTTNNFTTQQNFLAGESTSSLNNVVMVDGKTYPQTNAGIQAAVNATPPGGTIFFPSGTYNLTNTSGQQISITQGINFICAGWGGGTAGTILKVTANAPTIPLLRIVPSGGQTGMRIQDCKFQTASATGGDASYAIEVDTSPGNNFGNFVIDHIAVSEPYANFGAFAASTAGSATGGAIWFNNTMAEVNGGFYASTITNSYLGGQLYCTLCGDSLIVRGNTFRDIATQQNIEIDAGFTQGTSSFLIQDNYFLTNGAAIHIGGGPTFLKMNGNEMQTNSVASCSNGAMVDMDGTSANPITDDNILDNTWQIVNSATCNALRLNWVVQSHIHGNNRFGIGTGGAVGIITTSNALTTRIGPDNYFIPGTISTDLSDGAAGGATKYQFGGQNDGNTPLYYRDSTGVLTLYGYSNNLAVIGNNGNTAIYGGSASNNVAGTFSDFPSSATSPSGLTTGFLAAKGTQPTLTGTGGCATFSTQVGGQWAGTFKCTGTSGVATLTLTFTGAINGWACDFKDETTTADTFTPTVPGSPLTTCTASAAAVASGDVIRFTAFAF
jgi:hypothetical protein